MQPTQHFASDNYAGVCPEAMAAFVAANAGHARTLLVPTLGRTPGRAIGDDERWKLVTRLLHDDGLELIDRVAGALLLLVTPPTVFSGLVPWLLLFATVLFAVGPRLARMGMRQQADGGAQHALQSWRLPGLFAVAVYGGYFNGGLGILLMALYTLTGESRINTVNALKNLNSFVLSVLSVVAFAWAGAIVWREAALMAVAATLGGFAGARLARRMPVQWIRAIVIATGLAMSAVFFLRAR